MRRWAGAALATLVVAGGVAGGVVISGTPSGGACEWPTCFPDTSNTGVTDEGALVTVNTDVTLSTNGQVYEDRLVNGCVTVTASGVTIRNVRINCSGASSALFYDDSIGWDDTPLLIEDSEIDCEMDPDTHGFAEGNATFRRVEIRRCVNGMSLNQNLTLEDSMIHRLSNTAPDPHEDGIQMSCGHYTGNPADTAACGGANYANYEDGALNITLRHNTLKGQNDDGSHGTSAVISNGDVTGPDTNVLIEHNYLDGGASILYCPRPTVGTNWEVNENSFTDNFAFGRTDDCADETQAGNIDFDTGDPITLG
jgi:hypothetical protein